MSESLDSIETIEPLKTRRVTPRTARAAEPKTRGTSYVPKPATIPRPSRRDDPDDEDESFLQRNRVALLVGALVLIGGGWFFLSKPGTKSEPVRKAPEPLVIKLVMPPPPPPPPPPKVQPPPPKDERKVEQAPTEKPVEKPVEKPAEKPPESLGTSIKGGEGMAGLSAGGGNGMLGGTGTGKGGGSSMARWYAGQMGTKIAEALRNNRKTRSANMRVEAQVWVDPSGRITRATLDRSTGDATLDEALKNEVLPGIQIADPPPQGMRMPIPYRFTARRPN